MDHFPLFANVRDKPCLIVGAGKVALRKMRLLQKAGARVTLVAPAACPEVVQAARAGTVRWQAQPFAAADIGAHLLVISATGDAAVDAQVATAAAAAGRLCNVVDDPARCSFITPAIVDRGAITVAISSGGRSPTLTRWIKAQIERLLPTRIDELAKLAQRWRDTVRTTLHSLQDRQRLWLEVFDGAVAQHVIAGRTEDAHRGMTRLLRRDRARLAGGCAYLVGAGPGDAELITLRGARLLAQADIVLHDALISGSVLELARRDATFINVGKRAGHHALPQDEITRQLVAHVAAGARVCRLKGGDPLVFGRGGEEALALREAGLPFEIVPGVTAASACGAYAGIPLTHRGVADSVTFVTAHGCQPGQIPDYADLAAARRTVVFYMGAAKVAQIGAGLMAHGRSPDTPVAIVQNGTTRAQQVLITTLQKLTRPATGAVSSPATVVVGEVVNLQQQLAWFAPTASNTTLLNATNQPPVRAIAPALSAQ